MVANVSNVDLATILMMPLLHFPLHNSSTLANGAMGCL